MNSEDGQVACGLPPAQGLYDPRYEHDACGIGFVANIKGHKSHDIILKGIQLLVNLTHRGACGCDPETGDGAGVLIQIPHKFFARECAKLGFTLPPEGEYGVGMTFLPVERHQRLQCEGILERIVQEEGLKVLGWRETRSHISSRSSSAARTACMTTCSSASCTSSASAPKPKSPRAICPTRAS